jgi:hypothetical protein
MRQIRRGAVRFLRGWLPFLHPFEMSKGLLAEK